MERSKLEIAKKLYKPTEYKLGLVLMIEFILNRYCNGKVDLSGKNITVTKDKLAIKTIEVENSHCAILIHYEPNYYYSTNDDPYGSIFTLNTNSIIKILNIIKNDYWK
jgi:hypothetical protein